MSLITAPIERAPNENDYHLRPGLRDQISGSGRPNFASGRIFRVQYTLNQGWNGATKGTLFETKMLD